MHTSSLRLRYRGPACEHGPKDRWVTLDRNFTTFSVLDYNISSFNCIGANPVGYVSFRREWSYSTTCSSRLDAHLHRSTCSCC